MAVLDRSHPDIREFIDAKSEPGSLENFNLSVALTDELTEKARDGGLEGRRPRCALHRPDKRRAPAAGAGRGRLATARGDGTPPDDAN
jgi:ribonucleotide reductase alpha subunit